MIKSRALLIRGVCTCIFVLFAETFAVSADITGLYKAKFYQLIETDLFSSPAEYKRSEELRNTILSYMDEEGLLIGQEELEFRWKEYVAKNFNSPEEFENKLKNSYLDEAYVRKKFYNALIFAKYFDTVLKPALDMDLERRSDLSAYAAEQKISVDADVLREKVFAVIESHENKKLFKKFLVDNGIEVKDIVYLIQTDLLEDLLAQRNSGYKPNPAPSFRRKQFHYFTMVYAPKDIKGAKEQIKSVRDIVSESGIIDLGEALVAGSQDPKYSLLQVHDMFVPMVIDKDFPRNSANPLYSRKIVDTLSKLSIGEISPVIETVKGYLVLQIHTIEETEPPNS